jgi:hypothetical protein
LQAEIEDLEHENDDAYDTLEVLQNRQQAEGIDVCACRLKVGSIPNPVNPGLSGLAPAEALAEAPPAGDLGGGEGHACVAEGCMFMNKDHRVRGAGQKECDQRKASHDMFMMYALC